MVLFGGIGSLQAQSFVNKLPVPYRIASDSIHLKIEQVKHNFNPNGDTLNTMVNTYAFNHIDSNSITCLGPTIAWQYLHDLNTKVYNDLPHRATVHWHGAHVPAKCDGGPHQIIPVKNTWDIDFKVLDKSATMWYHPHVMDDTYEQVQMGMAGMVYVEDPKDGQDDPELTKLHDLLPHEYNVNDFPLVVQTKKFNYDKTTKEYSIDTAGWNKNFVYMVNGVMNPYLEVPATMVRLRVLNGDAKYSFMMGVADKDQNALGFELIATDAGYTDSSHHLNNIIVAPGGRTEWLIDLTGKKEGDEVFIVNWSNDLPQEIIGSAKSGAKSPIPYGNTTLMKLVVTNKTQPASKISAFPIELHKQDPPKIHSYTKKRTKVFRQDTLEFKGKKQYLYNINKTLMNMMVVDDVVMLDSTEVWTIKNISDVAHPFHIHDIHFWVTDVKTTTGSEDPSIMPYLTQGPLDNILVMPGWELSFVGKFDDFGTEYAHDSTYMFHCHILPHEDRGMMGQFVVWNGKGDTTVGVDEKVTLSHSLMCYPNPAHNQLTLQGVSQHSSQLRIYDLQGKLLKEVELPAFKGQRQIQVGDIKRGLTVLEWTTFEGAHTQKILLE